VTQAQNLISEIKREREREYEQLSLDELLIRAKTDGEQVYYFIGLKYYQGKEVRKDIDIALKYFYQAAKQGVIDAQNRIGELEAEQNKQRPLTELFMKANKGEAQAQYLLGLRYYEDEDKDIYTALEWFEKAAEQDVVEAQEMISVIEKYYEQLPLQTLFTQAEIGDKQAQYLLGLIYYQGTEVQQNMKLALEWLYKAA
jgi:TPR repeat protein